MDIIPPIKKNVVLDATTLTSIMTCGRFTDLRLNRQFGSVKGKSNSLEVGSIIHKVMEIYYRNVSRGMKKSDSIGHALAAGELYIKGCVHCTDFEPTHCSTHKEFPINEIINCEVCIIKPPCGHPANEYPGVKNTPPDDDKFIVGWKRALEVCEEYFEYYKNDFWVPLEAETVKREKLYEDDDIRILWKAKLDLIVDTNQGIYPCDHKTMKQRRDSVSLNNQFMGQTILMKTTGVIINKIGLQKTLKDSERFTRPMVNYTQERLIEWQSEILPYWAYKLLEYTETGYWPPNFTQCEGKFGHCLFKDMCEANPSMREEVLRTEYMILPKWDIDNVEE